MTGYEKNADSIKAIFSEVDVELISETWNATPISKELYDTCENLDFKLINPGRHFHKKYTFNSAEGKPSADCSIYVYPDKYSITIRESVWAPKNYDKWVNKLINILSGFGLNFKKISMGGSKYDYETKYSGSDIVDSLKSVNDELSSINPNELQYSNGSNPFSEGYNAYMKNNPTCPYKQGTPEFDDWLDGWQEAEMDMKP